MSNPAGTVQRLERSAYILGGALMAVLGVAVAVLGLLSLWQPAVACLGLAVALLAPLQFVQARRQLRTQKAALRQVIGRSGPTGTAPAPEGDALTGREIAALLSRTNRQVVALSEQVALAPAGAGDSDRLSAEVAALRAELSQLRAAQDDVRTTLSEGWAAVRADLGALAGASGTGRRAGSPGAVDEAQ